MVEIGNLLEILRKLESAERECVSFIGFLQGLGGCKPEDFNADTWNKRVIWKEILSGVIKDIAIRILPKTDCLSQLYSVVQEIVEENRNLLVEKTRLQESLLESQETVIELQKELLECKDGQLQSVEKVVKSEIRSYSEAVKSAKGPKTASVSVKEVQKVVQNVVEADDRSKNIIVFGLKESDDEDINVIIDEVLENVGCKPRHESVRIGFKKQTEADSNKRRPVKVSVASSAHAIAILRSAKRLKSVERFKNVFISPDRTTEERKSRREAVALLRKKTLDNPDKRFFIRNNKVLSD